MNVVGIARPSHLYVPSSQIWKRGDHHVHALPPTAKQADCWQGRSSQLILFAAGFQGCCRRRWHSLRLPRAATTNDGKNDEDLAESLNERTLQSLDFEVVISKLQEHCCTAVALATAHDPRMLLASSADDVHSLYAAVQELATLEDGDVMLSDSMDIQGLVDACSRGAVLEPPELRDVSVAIGALLKLRSGLERAAAQGLHIPTLLSIVEQIKLPGELLDVLLDAFDDKGELSESKFPEIAEMRARIRQLETQSATEMKKLLSSDKYKSYVSGDDYMQLGDHYVLVVKSQYASEVGRVITESRGGRTSYVEPRELASISSDLVELKRETAFAVRRILASMCAAVSHGSSAITACLQAAGEIDLARARLFVGEDMEGEVPEVRQEGVILARNARNPCMLLRGDAQVVGNTIELGVGSQGMILSGPNAGGKTVVLKTVGLLALLARCGIPVPAESPRIDFFKVVLAQIGDMQTIEDNLSTYSAHLVASRVMLGITAEAEAGASLVMVDEAGTGTDPMQGAALARAVLESLLCNGARIVATTHSAQLKNWALEDPRTDVAAMEQKHGCPTFKLVRNLVGESHAIETARRLNLPNKLVSRAQELLDEDQRSLMALQEEAMATEKQLQMQLQRAEEREDQATVAEKRARRIETTFRNEETKLAIVEADLTNRLKELQNSVKDENEARMDSYERKIEDIIGQIKRHAGECAGTLQIVGDTIEGLHLEHDKAAKSAKQRTETEPGKLIQEADALEIGDWVQVADRSHWHGFKGIVQQVTHLPRGAVRAKVKLHGSKKTLDVDKTKLCKALPSLPNEIAKSPMRGSKPSKHNYNKMVDGW